MTNFIVCFCHIGITGHYRYCLAINGNGQMTDIDRNIYTSTDYYNNAIYYNKKFTFFELTRRLCKKNQKMIYLG